MSKLTYGLLLVNVVAFAGCNGEEEPRGDTNGGTSGSAGSAGASGAPAAGGSAGTSSAGKGGTGTSGGGTGGAGQATGGAGNASASGGASGSGGTSGGSAGGSGGGMGGSGTAGACARPVGACSAPSVQITNVSLGSQVVGYGREGDTEPLPLAIAAMPSGGSRIAWLGTDDNVHIGELGCDDQLVGTPFTVPGIDLQDIHADDQGGVVLVTREATGSGEHGCGSGTLCGGESSPCRAMFMVRFSESGQIEWETQVTNLSDSLDGYDDGARFIWWYQHHGRLAFDGENYAAYFGVAITVNGANSCVDIHEGDRMQVVSASGQLVANHPDAFEVGCSHAWTSRIVWDDRSGEFVTVCATDNDCRIARPNPYRTIAQGECNGTLFGGDVVLSSAEGYWTAWSQDDSIRLQHFTDEGPGTSVNDAGDSQHPHLVSYGPSHMLLAYASGSGMTARIHDSGATGAAIGSSFSIDVEDHDYQAFKAYADGSVAYPAAGDDNGSMKIARVMPCN
jgi:hypothetical protein